MDIFSAAISIGSTGTFLPNNHKAILTFGSSALDASQNIEKALVRLNLSNLPESMDFYEAVDYIEANVKVEVAGAFWFGGSYAITALDCYAVPVTILNDAYEPGCITYAIGLDITGHVNRFGYTQVAVSLASNPENIAINLISGEVDAAVQGYNGGPQLLVTYPQ